MKIKILPLLLFFLTLGITLCIFFFYPRNDGNNEIQINRESKNGPELASVLLTSAADTDLQNAKSLINNMNNKKSLEYLSLTFSYISALHKKNTTEASLEAINMLRGVADDESVPAWGRSSAIAMLIRYAYTDPASFYAGDFPFYIQTQAIISFDKKYLETLELAKNGDLIARHELMKKLALFAESLEPIPFTSMFLANVYADTLNENKYRPNVEQLSNVQIQNKIETYIASADERIKDPINTPISLKSSALVTHLYWKGKVLGDIVTKVPKPTEQDFETVFAEAMQISQSESYKENNVFANYESSIHFYSALYLHRINKEVYETIVESHINLALEHLNQNLPYDALSQTIFRFQFNQDKAREQSPLIFNALEEVVSFSPSFEEMLNKKGIYFK